MVRTVRTITLSMTVPTAMIVGHMHVIVMVVTVRMVLVRARLRSHGRWRWRAFLQVEPGRRYTRPQHALRRDRAVLDRQATERGAQAVNREPKVEQRPEKHVAGGARETIEIRDPRH